MSFQIVKKDIREIRADAVVYPIHGNCLREAVSDANCDEYNLGIEPDEMEVEDTVTIVWEIE